MTWMRRLLTIALLAFAAVTFALAIAAEIGAWTRDDAGQRLEPNLARTPSEDVEPAAIEDAFPDGVGQQPDVSGSTARPQDGPTRPPLTPPAADPEPDPSHNAEPEPEPESSVIAYYFHNTHRCATCLEIEHRAYEAILRAFPDEISALKLRWLPVNMELPENQHVIFDYDLTAPSLVLVLITRGVEAEHRVLTRTWELVRETRAGAFDSYVIAQVQRMLGEVHD